MPKHITESEKLVQLTLNRKYMELEQKNKEIAQLQKELDVLKLQLAEDKETISQLCQQISFLLLKQKQNA
jgi:predicted RNase H-like nuclease (RuvC/YqgF family)